MAEPKKSVDTSCSAEESSVGSPLNAPNKSCDIPSAGDAVDVAEVVMELDYVLKMVFRNVDEADNFYSKYARTSGFDIRKYSKRVNKQGVIVSREWVCSRHGFRCERPLSAVRFRREKNLTRCGCRARFRILLDREATLYRVSHFYPFHNHRMETPSTAHLLKCNRVLKQADKSLLKLLTNGGLRPCRAMDLMEYIEGGPGSLSFRRKDGYNHLYRERREHIRNGDVNTALSLLDGMQILDPKLQYFFDTDENGSLSRLFWTDGMSRDAYRLFGDVIVFDSTYKTNTYRFPVVVISGVDNHFRTFVFGGAFIQDESVSSYVWLLKRFKDAMGNLDPDCVFTDQDASMRAAIEMEFPNAKHRICSWHLEQNAMQKVKKTGFTADFGEIIVANYSIEQFEEAWESLVMRHGVAEHGWVKDVYAKRSRWSEAYCRGHFMAKMTSTQRAESINSLLKIDADSGMTLTQFLKHYHGCVSRMRSKFAILQLDGERSTPPLRSKCVESLQRHASVVYTKKIFEFVQEEMIREQDLVLGQATNHGNRSFTFKFIHYDNPEVRSCALFIDWEAGHFRCECLMLETDGIPCRHIISGLKLLLQKELPQPIIYVRWTVAAGSDLAANFPTTPYLPDPELRRFAQLQKEAANMCMHSSQSEMVTLGNVEKLREMARDAEATLRVPAVVQSGSVGRQAKRVQGVAIKIKNIGDPKRIRARGASRASRQCCGQCGEPGHKIGTCPNPPVGKVLRGKPIGTSQSVKKFYRKRKRNSRAELPIPPSRPNRNVADLNITPATSE